METCAMLIAPTPTFTDEILDFLASAPSAQAIADYQPSLELVARSLVLHARNRDGVLTDMEREAFEELRRLNHFMNQLKIRARLNLRSGQDVE